MKKEGIYGRIICTLINHASLCYLNVSSRLIETLTSVSIKKKSFKFARPWIFTTVRWIMQWSVNYSSLPDRDGCALKSMQKWGCRMWCCVNTFHSGLLTRQIFVSTLILVFLMFASNKVPVTNQFGFACFSFWCRMIHCWNDITLLSVVFYNYFRRDNYALRESKHRAQTHWEKPFAGDGKKQFAKNWQIWWPSNTGFTVLEDKRKATDAIYLNLCKAFDAEPHNIFVSKLERLGFDRWMTQWIRNGLNGHTQRVVVNSSMSQWRPVTSDVSVAALFNIFVSSRGSRIRCTLSKFAYNIKLCGATNTLEGRDPIRGTLTGLRGRLVWTSCLKFNMVKCKILHLSRSNPKHRCSLDRD